MSDWQLDRLPGDVRQEAENSAQQDGLPLHRWLGRLIRETCADEGIALARELSPDLVREPPPAVPSEIPAPPRSIAEPIRVPNAGRFAEAAPAAAPAPRQPVKASDSFAAARFDDLEYAPSAAETPRFVEPAPAQPSRPAPRRFSEVPRMPEPRVAEAMHVIEPRAAATPIDPRPAAPPRAAVHVAPRVREAIAPSAREAIARDLAAVRSAAKVTRNADIAASRPPSSSRASFSTPPVLPQSTASSSTAHSPESSLSTPAESWSERRARYGAPGRNAAPRRASASDAATASLSAPSRAVREPMPTSAVPPRPASSAFGASAADERSTLLAKLTDGLRRNELSAVGEARLFLKLMTEHMASIGDITAATGRTPEQVSRSLRLLGLSDRLRDLIDRGALSREQAFALIDADPPPSNPFASSSGHRLP